MPARIFPIFAIAMSGLLLVSAFGAASAGSRVANSTPSHESWIPTSHEAISVLTANASFGGWTWTGPVCTPGQLPIFTAHFFGNASGGGPPYVFLWNFGDVSLDSSSQNPSHVFVGMPPHWFGWNVTLTVTDVRPEKTSAFVWVHLPWFSCPARQAIVPSGYPGLSGYYPLGAIVVGVVAILIGIEVVVLRRTRRGGGTVR